MPHAFVLFEEGIEADDLFALADHEHVRAVARAVGGAGIVFIHGPRLQVIADAVDRARAAGETRAISGTIAPVPPLPVTFGFKPREITAWATVRLRKGRQQDYARFLRGLGEAPDGYARTGNLVLGSRDIHALVEVVGPDTLGVADQLALLTAHEDVDGVQSFVIAAEHARGAGSPLALET